MTYELFKKDRFDEANGLIKKANPTVATIGKEVIGLMEHANALHNDAMLQKDIEIAKLEEYKFMYEGLAK